jgi:hypothetical protein
LKLVPEKAGNSLVKQLINYEKGLSKGTT